LKIFSRLIVVLSVSLPMLSCSLCNSQENTWRPKIGRNKRWMQIDCGSPSAAPETPIVELAAALIPNPQVDRFRVRWDFMVFSSQSSHVATYNRQRQTMLYRWKGFYSTGNVSRCYLFTGVTDRVIKRAAKAQQGGDKTVNVWENLNQYGCKRINVYQARSK